MLERLGEGPTPYERSVLAWYADPAKHSCIVRNFLEPDLGKAVQRYMRSEEFATIWRILQPRLSPAFQLLDLGVGRGLTSLAFESRGVAVTCVERDRSEITGLGAPARYLQIRPRSLRLACADGERLPFAACSFDAIFCRSVLHHLNSLDKGLREILRVLKPGGIFTAWNEHILEVLSSGEKFFAAHPAVCYGVNENAYAIPTYWWRIRRAGFRQIHFGRHHLNRQQFLEAAREKPIYAALAAMPVGGDWLMNLLYGIHVIRRTVLVQEEALPVTCILAQKSHGR